MKKIIYCLIIALVICLSATACGENQDKDVSSAKSTVQQETETPGNTENNEDSEPDTSASPVDEEYTVEDSISTSNSSGKLGVGYILLPEVASMLRGAGQVADQSDDTLILLGGQHLEQSFSADKLENVFVEYLFQPIDVLSKYRRVDYKDYAFEIEGSEIVEINDYTMCKHTGTHTYTHDGVAGSMSFVAYITQLKSNDAYVYWIVLDESETQSQYDKINDCAKKIAESLHEEDLW